MFNKGTNSFEKKPSVSLAPDDSCEYEVALTPCFYENNLVLERSVQTKFVYHKIFRGSQFIPKDETVTLEITMECKKRLGSLRLQLITESTVNSFLKAEGLCEDFDPIEVKVSRKPHYSWPIFVRNIRYMKRWDP